MKYLYLLLPVLALSSCVKPAPHQFICLNPAMILQSVQINSADPEVVETADYLRITTAEGNVISMPKSLCLKVQESSK